MKSYFNDIKKIGIVVNNIENTIKTYSDLYGIGPWNVWTLLSKDSVTENEDKVNQPHITKASAKIGQVEIELVRPLNSTGLFSDFLREVGEGVAYLIYIVDDFDEAVSFMNQNGKNSAAQVECNGLKTIFFDCRNELKHIVGIEKRVGKEVKPDMIYPKSGLVSKSLFNIIFQIGIVVKDIKKTVATYSDVFNMGFWSFSYFNPETVSDMQINEVPQNHDFIVATGMVGNVEIEFMQAYDDKSIYAEYLKLKGEGIQHICMLIEDFNETLKYMKGRGQIIKQYGDWYGCKYLYMSSENDLKFSVELYDAPPEFRRPPAAFSYPAIG